jgi:hypothetical protein
VGWIGETFSARWSLAVGGISCLLAAAWTLPAVSERWQMRRRGTPTGPAADAVTPGAGEPAAA